MDRLDSQKYKNKYFKYKNKYLMLKNKIGGGWNLKFNTQTGEPYYYNEETKKKLKVGVKEIM